MKKYKVIVLPEAIRDIRQNFRYIAESYENIVAAHNHTAEIYRKILSLDIFPNGHQVYARGAEFEYRVARVRHYRIFYYVDEDNKTVYVVRMMHSRREVEWLKMVTE